MTPRNNNDTATDRAWNRLYSRLEAENLLPDNAERKQPKQHSSVRIWISSAAVISVLIVSMFLFRGGYSTEDKMYTLHNDENNPTLVATLKDGSVVYLSGQTSLEYPDGFNTDKREVSLQGDAFFDIARNEEKPFFIDTELATVQVLGTAFDINSSNKSNFSLSVRNGEVKVTLKKTGQAVHVKGGESIALKSGYLHMGKSNKEQFEQYMKRIHFKDERLADVVSIINKNTDAASLEVAPELANRLLTVSFDNNTPETMAELISLALNLSYRKQDDKIIISGK